MNKLFLINKNAGAKDNQKIINKIERVYKGRNDFLIKETRTEDKAKQTIKEFKEGVIYLVGGDGTLGAMSECFINRDIALGIIPMGTANDFAKIIDSDFSIQGTIEPKFKKIDAYRANDRVGINLFSMGFDTMVLKKSYEVRKFLPNKISYYIGVLMSLKHLVPMELKISFNGEEIKGGFLISAICNGSYYGSGFYPGVNAKIDDGILNLIAIKMPPLYRIDLISKYRNGRILENPYTKEYISEKFTIECKKEVYANIDGHIIKDKHFEIEVIKNAITLAY